MNIGPYEQTPEAKTAFDARWQRVMDCVALKQPSRMPVVLHPTFWLAKYGGITCKELMYDYEKNKALGERAILEFEPDIHNPMFAMTALGQVLEATEFKQLNWPGHGMGDDQPYQYLDREYMKVEEYDEFMFDPTGFYLQKYLPRVMGIFEGIEEVPYLPGLHFVRLIVGLRSFAKPTVRQALEKVMKAAEEVERFALQNLDFIQKMASLGYPVAYVATSSSPYDLIADYFRGATNMMKDLYRQKDKLLPMLDKAKVFLLRQTIAQARASGNPVVLIPIHWAPDSFMSQKQFETYWWPSFREMLIGMIDAKLIPMVLWESDCTKRLQTIADIPAGKCIYWFERTDMVKAFEVLGDIVALRGNLSPSMMTTGRPDEVDAAVKHLVDNVWAKGGNLILDGASGLADETPIENVHAMFNAARKYAG